MVDSQEEAFEVQAVVDTEVEAYAMVEFKVQEYAVAATTVPLATLPGNPRTEDMVLLGVEEEGMAETRYYPPFTTPCPPTSLP